MADQPNDATCPGCGHLASSHADIADGTNSGSCAMQNCSCAGFDAEDDTEETAVTATTFAPTVVPDPAAPVDVEPGDEPGIAFRIPLLVPEGVRTDDGRMIAPGALTARETPMTLMVMFGNPDGGMGHDGALIGGRIDSLVRSANGEWSGGGEYDKSPIGAEAARLARTRVAYGISVDIADAISEIEIVATDADGFPTEIEETLTRGVIVGATQCPMPAFRGCTIEVGDEASAEDEPVDGAPALAASGLPVVAWRIVSYADSTCAPCADGRQSAITAAGGPLNPPAAWFADPQLDGPTALQVSDDGRIYGHLAAWGTCHVGIGSSCVTPPRSGAGYSHFRIGSVVTAEGQEVATGPITLGTGHAPLTAGSAAAVAHYDNTGLGVADVAAGEDAHGIWIAGALRPGITDEQVRTLRASALSGDWRRVGRSLELVAALAVNTPGFPVPRPRALAASGVPMSLVAAGAEPIIHAEQAAPSGGDVGPLVQQTEAAIDAMRERLAGIDTSSLPDDVLAALTMLDTVDQANDAVLAALGVDQNTAADGDADPEVQAEARVAALESALRDTQAELAMVRLRRR